MNKHSFLTEINHRLSFAVTRLALLAVLCLAQGVLASTAAEIASYINSTAGPSLSASASGSTVTVTGTLGATPSNADYLTLNIDSDVTVIWQATLAGTPSSSYSLININGGFGTFNMSSGSIENTGTGRVITNSSASAIRISGGTVKANGGNVIYNSSSGNITVSSGTVSATSGYAIYNYYYSTGNITVSGGTVSTTSGTAIYDYSINATTINVSGGTVSTTSGYAISNDRSSHNITVSSGTVKSENSTAIRNYGTLSVSGGTVSSTSGYAISNSGTTTISGNAKITSARTSYGTIDNYGTLNINGGTVENTATSTSSGESYNVAIGNNSSYTVNVSGGTVSATNGHAIYGGKVNISGGTVRTSGNSKSAVYNTNLVKITGGTVSATQSGYGVWNGSSATLTLGNSPAITGRLYTYPEKLSVITTAPDIFNPGSRVYTLDFPEAQYAASKIAVMDGAGFRNNFTLYNPDWALNVAGQHLSIVKAVKVSFSLNGGIETPPATIGVAPGNKVPNKPSTSGFTRNGYTNDGEWYTSATGTTAFVFGESGTSVNQNITLYLKWTPITYTITYTLNDGTVSTDNPASYDAETATFTLINPTKENYIFAGWTGSNGTTPQTTLSITKGSTGNKSYTANWTPVYTVTYNANGGSVTPESGTTGIGGKLASLPTPTRNGYTFNAWYTAETGGTQVTVNTAFSADATIYARWTLNTYTITFNANGGTVSPTFGTTGEGWTLASLPTPTRTSYTFGGWFTAAADGEKVTESRVYSANTTIYARWTLAAYTVIFADHDGTELLRQTVNHGSAATAPANPIREGYTFTGWSVAFNNVQSNLTVKAEYTENGIPNYAVIFVDWDGTVLKNREVTLGSAAIAPTDPTREGYTFTGWDVAFNNVTSHLIVTAQYQISTYTVTFVDWDGTVLIAQTGLTYGLSATAPTTPTREGYTFTGWDVAFNNVQSNLTVTAVYEDITALIIKPKATNGFGIVLNVNSFQIVGISQATPINIYNMQGKIMMTRTAMPNESISVSHLPKGMYIVKATFGSEKQILRMPLR